MQSYQTVASEFYRYRDAIRELGRTPRSGQVYEERFLEARSLSTDWNRSLATLWLLTVCQLEMFGVEGEQRMLVAYGQQTLIRVAGPE